MRVPNKREFAAGERQPDKFKESDRELDCDEDDARWDEGRWNVAASKPAPGTSE
jgi:hypothetical protein